MGGPVRHSCQGCGQRGPARRVVAAVQPELGPACKIHQWSVAQPLHPGGPVGAGDGCLGIAKAKQAQRHQGGARVVDLMGAGQVWQGQV